MTGTPSFCLGPTERFGIAALSCKKEAEAGEVVLADELSVGVLLPDRAEGGRCREERAHAVLLDHAPEGAGSGVPTGLPS